jgi:hypothetical protein
MTRLCAAAIAFAIVLPAELSAHRLDEYLQAARLSLARDCVTLELDLTPGANIAASIAGLLDRDGNSTISPTEAQAYGEAVLSELMVAIDGRPVSLALTRVEAPSIGEMRAGSGTIQIRAAGPVDVAAGGRRRLDFRNNHQPAGSIYLVNALMPQDGAVSVVAQTRDHLQQGVRVEYAVHRPWQSPLLWLVLGAAGVATFVRWRPGFGGVRL